MFSIIEISSEFCAGAQRIYPSRELAGFVLSSNAKCFTIPRLKGCRPLRPALRCQRSRAYKNDLSMLFPKPSIDLELLGGLKRISLFNRRK